VSEDIKVGRPLIPDNTCIFGCEPSTVNLVQADIEDLIEEGED